MRARPLASGDLTPTTTAPDRGGHAPNADDPADPADPADLADLGDPADSSGRLADARGQARKAQAEAGARHYRAAYQRCRNAWLAIKDIDKGENPQAAKLAADLLRQMEIYGERLEQSGRLPTDDVPYGEIELR